MKQRAVSLAETVIAIFILMAAIAVMTLTLHVGLRHQGHTERRMLAVQLARKKLAELRAWVRTPTTGSGRHFDDLLSDWKTFVGSGDPDYPGYIVASTIVPHQLFSPCSSMEAPYVPLNTSRRMDSSAKKVKISVIDPAEPGWTATMVTVVCDPTRDLAAVNAVHLLVNGAVPANFTPSGNNLQLPNPGSYLDMRAEAICPDGRAVPDMFFDWYVVPLGGSGTVLPARDGRTCRFVNGVLRAPGLTSTTEGRSVVAVHGSYRGQGQPPQNYNILVGNPYISISPLLELGPP